MDAGTLKQRLEQFPSHFHWKLEDQSERERTDLRNRIEGGLAEHPDKLPVCYMTLVGYLWVSPLDKKEHFKNALQWFHKASEINSVEIEQESKRGNKGPIGDKIILLTNKAMLQLKLGMHNSVKKLYKEIEKLFQEKTPEIEAYITAHKAFASRQFGPAKYNIAAELFKEALECFPENVDWLEEYGKVIGRIERNMELADCAESSERVLEQVIKLDPSRHLSRVLLAQIYQDKKLYDAAEEQIDTAIKLTKGKLRITVMQRIGQFYRKQRRFDEALTCFEEVRTANPKSVFNLDQMALTYKAKSYAVRNTHQSHVFLETALKLCQEACDISEENSDVKLTMAHILLLFGRHSDARICYAELSETAGAGIKSKVHFRFGQFLDRIGDKPDAIEQYISAIRCNHESFFGKKAVDKIFEMKNILHSELGNDRALDILGWVHSKLGDLKTAVFYYETEWETNHTDELREVLIDLHLKLRNIEKTKHYLKDVKESESVDKLKGRHHNLVGEEENKLGKIAAARKEFSISTQYFCLDGAENLIRILTKCSIEQTCENEWFTDCAKIADFIA
ncbi:antiviral innate immune response effector IFIT1-like [Saccoglossus kowalevskii]|uniref:Interferon-induced protein with tetratricopeptide repeats 1B-like n=1 Tax=Saccoglossus kowalevskii TaxID=10224 RepID=A0ABM0LWZ0_SACKO|nr:PREDICTED: interferon-induced protein with tetratricopeptide repeats 1B-like [Saccoglossus kowalevskii]